MNQDELSELQRGLAQIRAIDDQMRADLRELSRAMARMFNAFLNANHQQAKHRARIKGI